MGIPESIPKGILRGGDLGGKPRVSIGVYLMVYLGLGVGLWVHGT